MTNQEILEKAIQKAIDGGLNWGPEIKVEYNDDFEKYQVTINSDLMDLESVIFNHDFAKALWGVRLAIEVSDNESMNLIDIPTTLLNYQYHLQQMVIAQDPIKYLGEHLG